MKKKILLFGIVLISQPAFSANLIAEKIYTKTHKRPVDPAIPTYTYHYDKKCSVYDNGNVVIDFSTEHLKSTKTTKLQITTASLKAMVENVYKEIQPKNDQIPNYGISDTNIFYKGKKSAISCSSQGFDGIFEDPNCTYSKEFNAFMYENCGE